MSKACAVLLLPIAVFMSFATLVAEAGTYYFKENASDWSDPDSYTMNAGGTTAAETYPGENDTGCLPPGTYSIAVPSDNFTVFSKVLRVMPAEPQRVQIVFNVADGTYTNAAAIAYSTDNTYATGGFNYTEIVKKGEGTLVLEAGGVLTSLNGKTYYDYYSDITVLEGTLKLPQHAERRKLSPAASRKPSGSTCDGLRSASRTRWLIATCKTAHGSR